MSGRSGTKLSSKFQISVPKAVRESQGWQAGQEFAFLMARGESPSSPFQPARKCRACSKAPTRLTIVIAAIAIDVGRRYVGLD